MGSGDRRNWQSNTVFLYSLASPDSESVGTLYALYSLQVLLQGKARGHKPSLQTPYLSNSLLFKHSPPLDASHLLCMCYADDQQMLNKLDGVAHCAENSTRNYTDYGSHILCCVAQDTTPRAQGAEIT